MLSLLLLLAAMLAPSSPDAGRRPHARETSAERLYRKGVFCMEDIERPECAIRNFEALMRERTGRRDLITDGMLRLITLYRAEGTPEKTRPLLRTFWDAGTQRRQTGHLPFLALRLPSDVDVMGMVNARKMLDAPITRQMPPDAAAWVITCDPGKLQLLSERRRWKRAEIVAKREGKRTIDVIYEQQDARAAVRGGPGPSSGPSPAQDQPAPLFGKALCPLATALGQDDMAGWSRVAFALSHEDFSRSYVVVEIPKVAPQLERAVAEGRLTRVRPRIYRLPDLTYDDEPVFVAHLDLDELVIARAGLIPELERNRNRPRSTLGAAMRRLLGEVPKDSAFLFVMTERAIGDLGLGNMPKLLRALLPRPKGLQVAGVVDSYFGLFVRMPSDNQVKGQLLISLASRFMEPDEDTMDPETLELMSNLDLSQATDGRALLMSFVLDPAQVRRIFFY